MEELKLCPFCGGEGIETVYLGGLWRTACGKCGASIGLCKTEAEAITAWNTRTTDGLVEKLVGALEGALRIDDLWLIAEPANEQQQGEAEALSRMKAGFDQALAEYKKH